jgi:hypothetical protein
MRRRRRRRRRGVFRRRRAMNAMSKKDFIALADTLRGLHVPKPVLDAIVSFCKQQNRRFMEDRWRSYLAGSGGPSGGRRNPRRRRRRRRGRR